MNRQQKSSAHKPVHVLAASFLGLIVIGTLVLMLPECHAKGNTVSPIDCFFTSTSAVCVTGLITVDTATAWSRLGQVIILILIQIGGIGIVTFGSFFALLLGQKFSFNQRELIREQYGEWSLTNLWYIIPVVAGTTFVIELTGAILLYPSFQGKYETGEAVFHSVFHAISAFCNAGFSTFSSNLMGYQGDLWVNLIVCVLIVTGGLGFPVIAELLMVRRRRRRLSLHSKMVLTASGILIVVGALAFFFLECSLNPEYQNMPISRVILISFFQSITARTAGFNTVDFSTAAPATLVFVGILMFIGGSPSGTAGGIKTTTLMVSIAAMRSVLTGSRDVVIFGRRLQPYTVRRGLVLVILAMCSMVTGTLLLLYFGGGDYLKIGFETLSALGTVGLSAGITPFLGPIQKIVIIMLMFIGRIGPMSFGLALAHTKVSNIRYAETDVLTG